MGIFSFIAGAFVGIYVAQNYNFPNLQKLVSTGKVLAKHIDESYRKPKKPDVQD